MNKKALSDNPIGAAADWWRTNGLPPWATLLLGGGLVYGVGRGAWGPSVETLRSIGRPLGRRMLGEGDAQRGDILWDQAMDNLKDRSDLRRKLPAYLALLSAAGGAAALYRPNERWGGMLDWDAEFVPYRPSAPGDRSYYIEPLVKTAMDGMSYVQSIPWERQVNLGVAKDLFNNDPNLRDNPYIMNMGTAIVSDAAIRERTSKPTLGGIFDSAVNKIENKLSFGGLAKVGLRTAVANGAARLFTGALGTVCDLSPAARQTLVDAGTWAGAITAILE